MNATPNLESIVVLNRNAEINLQFSGALLPKLKEYITPYNSTMGLVNDIGDGNFYGIKTMERIVLPETLVWENEYGNGTAPFSICENMEIVLPSTLKELRTLCNSCKNMRIVIPNSVTKIYKSAFQNCKKSEITIVTQKGSYAEKYAKENGYSYEYY